MAQNKHDILFILRFTQLLEWCSNSTLPDYITVSFIAHLDFG